MFTGLALVLFSILCSIVLMRISQKLEYACRAMVQLAQHHDGQTLIQLDDIAQREAVSANFLVQILNDLKRGDLIISKRGKTGGYLLARDPREINLLDITKAADPGMLSNHIPGEGESGRAIHDTWNQIHESLIKELSSITLDSLTTQTPMFYI